MSRVCTQQQHDGEGHAPAQGRQHLRQVLRPHLQAKGEAKLVVTIIPLIAMQEYLAEGEETPSERRARLAREAEERDRARLAGDLHV